MAVAATLVAAGCTSEGAHTDATTTGTAPDGALLHVAVDGRLDASGSADDPFGDLGSAHAAARPGQTIQLAAGDYPFQSWSRPSAAPSDPVRIRAAEGARVQIDGIRLDDVDDVELVGLTTRGWYINSGSERVTLRDVRSQGAGAFITSADDVRVEGGTIGPADSIDGLQIKAATDGPAPQRVVIDGLVVRDITRRADPSKHVDCIQVGAAEGLTIRRVRMSGCATQGLFLRPFGGGRIAGVVVENSWFGAILEGFSGLIVDEDVGPGADIRIRYNSSLAGMRIEAPGAEVVGNIAPLRSYGCVAGVRYRHNVWSEARCDPTDTAAPAGFIDGEDFDLNLRSDAAARGAGDPDDAPQADIDGRARPADRPPDAGASQYVD